MKRNDSRINTFSAAIVFLLLFSLAVAQPPPQSKILVIDVRLKNNVLSLEKTKVVSGALKPARFAEEGDLYYEITSRKRSPVFSRLIRIPKQNSYDYIDSTGQLRGGTSEQEDVRFVIRVPYNEAMENISFYSAKPRTGGSFAKIRSPEEAKGAFIASFPLNAKAGLNQ